MNKDCPKCEKTKGSLICLYHTYIVAIHSHLNVVHSNLWNMEVNELSLSKSDNLRVIMGQISDIMNSLDNVVKQPEHYSIEKIVSKK